MTSTADTISHMIDDINEKLSSVVTTSFTLTTLSFQEMNQKERTLWTRMGFGLLSMLCLGLGVSFKATKLSLQGVNNMVIRIGNRQAAKQSPTDQEALEENQNSSTHLIQKTINQLPSVATPDVVHDKSLDNYSEETFSFAERKNEPDYPVRRFGGCTI